MNLPNFINFEPFNQLRRAMRSNKLGHYEFRASTGKALDRRAAGIELEPQTVDVDEHAGTGTPGVRDRATRPGDRHGGGHRLPP